MWTRIRRTVLAAVSVGRMAGAAAGPVVRETRWAPQDYAMSPGVLRVPATCWAGPRYSGGHTSVLVFFVEPANKARSRLLVELSRAGDFTVEYVRGLDEPRQMDHRRAARLLGDRAWDVVLFLNYRDWECTFDQYLTDEIRGLVMAQAERGAGLLFTDRPPEHLADQDCRFEIPAGDVWGGVALTGRFARDRAHWRVTQRIKRGPPTEETFRSEYLTHYRVGDVLAVDFSRRIMLGTNWRDMRFAEPWSYEHRIDAEYALAELVRAILAAANRLPQVAVTQEPPARWELPWTVADGQGVASWRFDVRGEARDLTFAWRLRRLTGAVCARGEHRVVSARGIVPVSMGLPSMGAGRHYLDVFVDGPAGRETYAYVPIEVREQVAIELTEFPAAVREGDSALSGRLSVTPGAPAAAALEVSVVDRLDRVLVRRRMAVPDEPVPVVLPCDSTWSLQNRIEAKVSLDGRLLAGAQRTFHVLPQSRSRFHVIVQGTAEGAHGHWVRNGLWRTGVTAVTAADVAGSNLLAVPYTFGRGFRGRVGRVAFDRFATRRDPQTGVMRPCCWNEAGTLREYVGHIRHHFDEGSVVPTLVYCMADDVPQSGCCLHAECLAAYRSWLREQYGGDLAALNEEWGSGYGRWNDVDVLEPGDVLESGARDLGFQARWADRRHFAYANFARAILGQQQRLARLYDPEALIGLPLGDGVEADMDELAGRFAFSRAAGRLEASLVRSVQPRRRFYTYRTEPTADPGRLIHQAWRQVLHGVSCLWWPLRPAPGGTQGWLAGNSVAGPAGQALLEDAVLPLRRGLGDLLQQLPRQPCGIALYHSPPAASADQLATTSRFGSARDSHEAFARLVEDCGYTWEYLTRGQLLNGMLDRRGVRLLILAHHLPLGLDEAEAMDRFVQEGGTLLADLRPGVCSAHLRPVAHGPADAIFGIERTGPGEPVRVDGRVSATMAGAPIALDLTDNRSDAHVRSTAAEAAGRMAGAPVFIINRPGRGRAILLNFRLSRYPEVRQTAQGDGPRALIRELASASGVVPPLRVTAADDRPLERCEVVSWSRGDVGVHGLLTDGAASAAPLRVYLPGKAHAFSWRHGPLGYGASVAVPALRPGYADFVAVYPYDPGQPTVDFPEAPPSRGEACGVSIGMSGVPPGRDVLFSYRLRLFSPGGEVSDTVPWSACGGPGTRIPIRIAYNDPPGAWELQVSETTTGRTGRVRFSVPPLPRTTD